MVRFCSPWLDSSLFRSGLLLFRFGVVVVVRNLRMLLFWVISDLLLYVLCLWDMIQICCSMCCVCEVWFRFVIVCVVLLDFGMNIHEVFLRKSEKRKGFDPILVAARIFCCFCGTLCGCYIVVSWAVCKKFDSLFINCHYRALCYMKNDQNAPGPLMQKTAQKLTNLGLTCGQRQNLDQNNNK